MKKLLCLLFSLLLCINFCNITAFAANEKLAVKAVPSATTLSRNDIFTVDFNLTSNAGFVTLGLEVSYNTDVLEIYCAKHVDGKNCTGSRSPVSNMLKPSGLSNNATNSRKHTVIPYKIMWAFGNAKDDVKYTGRIATLTFRVKEDAVLGKTDITVNIDQATSEVLGGYKSANRLGSKATVDVTCIDHKFGIWDIKKAPNCTEKGTEYRACAVCNKIETRDTQAIGHQMGEWQITKESTCTEEGTQTLKCTRSDCTYSETKKLPLKSHVMGEWSFTKEPTCIQTGSAIRKCTTCNKEEVGIVPKGDHTHKSAVVTLEPTCTSEGIKQGECTVCGEKNAEVKIPAKGHSFGNAVVTKEPTDTEAGIKTATCTVCGEKKQEKIPALAPTPEEPTKEPVEEPTESDEQAIIVITDNADNADDLIIVLLIMLIVIGISATVIAIVKIKRLK